MDTWDGEQAIDALVATARLCFGSVGDQPIADRVSGTGLLDRRPSRALGSRGMVTAANTHTWKARNRLPLSSRMPECC